MKPLRKNSDHRRYNGPSLWEKIVTFFKSKPEKLNYMGKTRQVHQLIKHLINSKERVYALTAPRKGSSMEIRKAFFEANLDNDLTNRELEVITKMHILTARFILTDWDVDFDNLLTVMEALKKSLEDKNYVNNE